MKARMSVQYFERDANWEDAVKVVLDKSTESH